MYSIPARMKKIQLKMKALECSQDFSHYKSMGIFPEAQGQLTPQSLVRFELIQDVMDVLVTCKYEEDPIKMKALEWTQHYTAIFQTCKADNSGVGVGIWPNFELIQAFMHVLVTCKNEDD